MSKYCRVVLLVGAAAIPVSWASEAIAPAWQVAYESGVEALRENDLTAARQQLETALGLAEELGFDDKRYFETLINMRMLHGRANTLPDNEELFTGALERCESTGKGSSGACVYLMEMLGDARGQVGDIEGEERYYRSALAAADSDGASDSSRRRALLTLSMFLERQGREDEAIPLAVRRLELIDPDKHISRAHQQAFLARLKMKRGEHEEAEALLEEAMSSTDDLTLLNGVDRQYAKLLNATGREEQATHLMAAAEAARSAQREREIEERGPPYRAGFGGVSEPRKIGGPGVAGIPRKARNAGASGNVTLQLTVATDGTVSAAEVLKCSNPGYGFEEAAVEAAREWVYEPILKDGEAVEAYVTTRIYFEVQR